MEARGATEIQHELLEKYVSKEYIMYLFFTNFISLITFSFSSYSFVPEERFELDRYINAEYSSGSLCIQSSVSCSFNLKCKK